MTKTIKLSKPVQDVSDTTVTELVLREPTGGDLVEVGAMPFTIETANDGLTRMEFNVPVIFSMIAALANVHPLVVRRLSGNDFYAAALTIIGFFNGATQATSSIDVSNSPVSSVAA